VPLWFEGERIATPEKLPEQGFSNENYRFIRNGKTYLLRQFKLQDRDRRLEFDIQALAYAEGIAAKPYKLNLSEGYMVCDFLEGEHREKLERSERISMARLLQTLHGLRIETPPIALEKHFASLDTTCKMAFKSVETFPAEYVLCHNDLNPKNWIFGAPTPKLIDWEFAGMNDRYFDLAAVSVEFHFNRLEEACFLDAYFQNRVWYQTKLNAYKVIYSALCKAWFEAH